MSRIMLAVKAILAQYSKLPTLIFDEIDTGVSGEIANRMGEIMKGMSTQMQIFAITHLPQIAAKGTEHFKVFKSTVGDDTQSELKLLTNAEAALLSPVFVLAHVIPASGFTSTQPAGGKVADSKPSVRGAVTVPAIPNSLVNVSLVGTWSPVPVADTGLNV